MRKGKEHRGQGEVSVHLSPRNSVTLNSTFIRFANRPRGKVLDADQRSELQGREEVLIRPKPTRDFQWKWGTEGANGLRWGTAVREGGEPLSRVRPAIAGRTQLGAAAESARRPEPPAGPNPISRPIRRFVPALAAGGPSASPPRAEGPC